MAKLKDLKRSDFKLLVIEGADGVGKSSIVAEVVKKMKERGENVVFSHLPNYEAESSFFVRRILHDDDGFIRLQRGMDETLCRNKAFMIASCYSLDRASTILNMEIEPGSILVLDRYTLTNIVYQTYNLHRMTKPEWQQIDNYDQNPILHYFTNAIVQMEADTLNIPYPDTMYIISTSDSLATKQLLQQKEMYDNNEKTMDMSVVDLMFKSISKDLYPNCQQDILYITNQFDPENYESINASCADTIIKHFDEHTK